MADIGSLLEVSISLNLAYALVRSLADYECNIRETKAKKYRDIFVANNDVKPYKKGDKEAFESIYELAALEIESQLEKIKPHAKWAIVFCLFFGVVGIIWLFNELFLIFEIPTCAQALGLAVMLIHPIAWAGHLWDVARTNSKDIDAHLGQMREWLTSQRDGDNPAN